MKEKLLYYFLIISFLAQGQSIQLDGTFGTSGFGYTEYNEGILAPNYLSSAVQTSDGNFVLTGYSQVDEYYGRSHFVVAKVSEAGYVNTFGGLSSYGYTGLAMPVWQATGWSTNGQGKDVLIQPDGKIVAVGWQQFSNSTYPTNGTFILVTRLNSDGSLDTTFDGDGIQTVEINGNDFANTVALQSDGKIIIGGYTKNGAITESVISRLNTDGTLDNTFDSDGYMTFSTGNNYDCINDIVIQNDGKIVACGQNASNNSGSILDFMTLRLNTNGSFDTTFNSTGTILTNFDNYRDLATCLTIQPDNKILVAGYSRTNISSNYSDNYAIVRYNTDGTLDTTFSGDGKYYVGFGTLNEQLNSIFYSSASNTIYLSGSSYQNSTNKNDFLTINLTSSGSLNTSFNGTGYLLFNTGDDDIAKKLIYTNSNLYVFGNYATNFSLYKVLASSYKIYNNFLNKSISPIRMQKANNTFFCSHSVDSNHNIVSFDNNGNFDNSFGNLGVVSLQNVVSYDNDEILKKTNDNKLLASGYNKIYKYNLDGTLDTTFGNFGILDIPLQAGEYIFIDDIIVLSDNSFYVISDTADYSPLPFVDLHFTIWKFNADGTLDTSYGTNGIAEFLSSNDQDIPSKGVLQSDGKLIVIGTTRSFSPTFSYNFQTIRLNSDGTLDTSFGINGIQILNIPNASEYCKEIKILNDGTYICVFHYINPTTNKSEINLVKFNSDGSLNNLFGNNGLVHENLGESSSNHDFIVLNNNKILVSGTSKDVDGWNYLTLALFNSDGTLDTTFADNGVFLDYPDGFSDYFGGKINLETDDKITLTASSDNSLWSNSNLIRYTLDTNLGTIDFTSKEKSFIYPNPIETTTTLSYNLTNSKSLTLELYDIKGKLVETYFENTNKEAGQHEEKLDLTNIPTGNYILKLSSSENSTSLKIIKK